MSMKISKKSLLLSILAAFFAVSSSAQNFQSIPGFGFSWNGGEFKTVINIPNRCDTAFTTQYRATLRPGSFFWNNCTNQRWVFYNDGWHIDSAGRAGTGGGSGFSIRKITSANFSAFADCPLPALNNDSLQIFWNDLGRFLTEGSEWQNLAGGGFRILVPGFDAIANSYSLTLYANNVGAPPGPLNFTSASFTSATNCPITQYNGMTISVFWNDAGRYLVAGTEFTPLAGGGFTVTVPGFDATANSYSFYVFAQ